MNKFIFLFLLIPSLSWSEDIKLSCDYIKEMIVGPDGEKSFNRYFKNPNILVFNSNDKSLIRYYEYGNKEYYLDSKKSDEAIYYYRYENISMNVIHSEILELNRFTLEISGETFKDTSLKTIYSMECKITNQLL